MKKIIKEIRLFVLFLLGNKDEQIDLPKDKFEPIKFIDMRNFPPPPDSKRVRDIKQMLSLIDSLSEDLQKAQWKVISECAEKYSKLTPFEESNPSNKKL